MTPGKGRDNGQGGETSTLVSMVSGGGSKHWCLPPKGHSLPSVLREEPTSRLSLTFPSPT